MAGRAGAPGLLPPPPPAPRSAERRKSSENGGLRSCAALQASSRSRGLGGRRLPRGTKYGAPPSPGSRRVRKRREPGRSSRAAPRMAVDCRGTTVAALRLGRRALPEGWDGRGRPPLRKPGGGSEWWQQRRLAIGARRRRCLWIESAPSSPHSRWLPRAQSRILPSLQRNGAYRPAPDRPYIDARRAPIGRERG